MCVNRLFLPQNSKLWNCMYLYDWLFLVFFFRLISLRTCLAYDNWLNGNMQCVICSIIWGLNLNSFSTISLFFSVEQSYLLWFYAVRHFIYDEKRCYHRIFKMKKHFQDIPLSQRHWQKSSFHSKWCAFAANSSLPLQINVNANQKRRRYCRHFCFKCYKL